MNRDSQTHVVTANDLLSGDVVYYSDTGFWTAHHHEAMGFENVEGATRQLRDITNADTTVIGPCVAQARIDGKGVVTPVHFREIFRATGPSNRFLGKQAVPSN